jgi:hypothetical protein
MKNLTVVVGAIALAGCASVSQPSTQMRPFDDYLGMDCRAIQSERETVASWEQYRTDAQASEETGSLVSKATMWSAVAISMVAATYGDAQGSSEAMSMVDGTSASAAASEQRAESERAQREELTERKAALDELSALKQC